VVLIMGSFSFRFGAQIPMCRWSLSHAHADRLPPR
jgi:hypothetical protein